MDVVLEREDEEDRGNRGEPVKRLEGVLQTDGCKTPDMNVNRCGDLTDLVCRNDTNAVSEDRLARTEMSGSGIVLDVQITTSQSQPIVVHAGFRPGSAPGSSIPARPVSYGVRAGERANERKTYDVLARVE